MRIQCDRALRKYLLLRFGANRSRLFTLSSVTSKRVGCRVRWGRRQAFGAKRRSGQLTDAIAPSEMTSDSCSSDAESETSSADADGAICHPACNGNCRDGSVYRDGSVCHPTSDDEDMGELEAETETAELASGGQICCCGAVEPSACLGRPSMTPRSAGAKVFSSASTPCSRALASQVRTCALQTSRVHGRSNGVWSAGSAPWSPGPCGFLSDGRSTHPFCHHFGSNYCPT